MNANECERCSQLVDNPDLDLSAFGRCDECERELEAEQEARDRIEETL